MKNKKNIFKIHSIIDVITNSSTELFTVDTSKCEALLKEIFLFLANADPEASLELLKDCDYIDDYIIPEDLDLENVYVCQIDQNNQMFWDFIEKYLNVIDLKCK